MIVYYYPAQHEFISIKPTLFTEEAIHFTQKKKKPAGE